MVGVVFISFASKDRSFASTICEALENRGLGCWIATRDISPGENFQQAVFQAIRSAKVMVLVFSSNSQNSDEVKKEIVLAGQCRLTVIPVRVEDVTPDGAFAYELATRQWVDLFVDWERSILRLVEQIGKVVGQEPGAVSVIRPPGSSAGGPGVGAPSRPPPSGASRPAASPRATESTAAARASLAPTGAQAKKSSWALIGGTGVLAVAVIVAAVWFWGRPRCEAGGRLPRGRCAKRARRRSTARITSRRCGGIAKPPTRETPGANLRRVSLRKGLGVPQDLPRR